MRRSPAVLAARVGMGPTALGALGVLLSDGPYLGFHSLSPWIVVYAIGLFVVIFTLPFGLHARMESRTGDRERRWEMALVRWGAIAIGAGFAFGLLGLAGGFAAGAALTALSLVGIGICALVVGALLVLMLSTG